MIMDYLKYAASKSYDENGKIDEIFTRMAIFKRLNFGLITGFGYEMPITNRSAIFFELENDFE